MSLPLYRPATAPRVLGRSYDFCVSSCVYVCVCVCVCVREREREPVSAWSLESAVRTSQDVWVDTRLIFLHLF